MFIYFKSKLYREEILKWILVIVLIIWGFTSTILLLKKTDKLVLIGIDESGSRLITSSNDRILQSELKLFFQEFLTNYYNYNDKTFSNQIELSSNLMSSDLWESQKSKLIELKEKLAKSPLNQSIDIESIDLIDHQTAEAILNLQINSKIADKTVKIKVKMVFEKHERSEVNPWNYQITEVQDAQL